MCYTEMQSYVTKIYIKNMIIELEKYAEVSPNLLAKRKSLNSCHRIVGENIPMFYGLVCCYWIRWLH